MKLSVPQVGAYLFVFVQPFVSAQFTYWVDQTCTNTQARQNAFNAAIRGALDFANRGAQRLASNTDTMMQDNIQHIFQANWNQDQNVRNQVNDVFGNQGSPNGVSQWHQTGNRQQSNVRIYCDNDPQNPNGGSRWTLAPDVDPLLQWPGYVPNAQRPRAYQPGQPAPGSPGAPDYQEWIDRDNEIYTLSQGCQSPGVIQGETYRSDNPFNPPPAGQPAQRSTVTLCDVQLNSQLHSFNDIPQKKDIAALVKPPAIRNGIDAFSSMTAFTLMHEFCHTRPFSKNDFVQGNGNRAYDWVDIVGLATADGLTNVNNFVYTSVLAVLADRHWRLSKVYNQWHNEGRLVYDLHGITSKVRRTLSWTA